MWQTIINFFAAIIAFFMSLFNIMPGTVVEFKNISYGSHAAQVMDIYYPDKAANIKEELGAMVLIHGGGWTAGDKSNYASLCKEIANRGYIAATINYRMIQDKANAFDMLEDIDAAIGKLKDKTTADGITVKKIATYGDSAGGHLSMLYSFSHINGTDTEAPIPIAFCVGRVGPANFQTFVDSGMYTKNDMFGVLTNLTGKTIISDQTLEANMEFVKAVSPYWCVSEEIPPTLIAYGAKDDIVPILDGRTLRDKLATVEGISFDYFEFPNSGHGLDNKADATMAADFNNKILEYAEMYF